MPLPNMLWVTSIGFALSFLCTIMTPKEIEGNEICGLFAHVGPNIKRMNLNINKIKIVENEVVY